MDYMRQWQKIWAGFLFLFIVSCFYLISLFARTKTLHPQAVLEEIIRDTAIIGPWAFILDICFLFGVGVFFRRWRKNRQTSVSIWKNDEGYKELLMDLEPIPLPPPPSPEEAELMGILRENL